MATNGLANNSSEIWVWDPVKGPNFEHPGAIPVDDFDRAKSIFIYRHCGPFLAKISRAIVKAYDDVAGVATIIRQGGQTEAMPRGRVIHWCEGLLILQSIKASRYQVDWFTRDLEHLMNQQLAKMQQLTAHHYVQERLLNEVVTGAKYKDMKRITHSFRRRGLLAEDRETRPANPATLDEMMGFWKIDKIAGYMPPWEAFLEFGIYQDFYLVYWQHPFQHVDYCSTENGSCILGTTWEPDECLPPHLDDIRLREKRAWIKRRKDAGAQVALEVQKGHGSKKRPRLDCHSTIPIAKHRRDGRPLERDLFCWRVGHDFQPEKMEDNVRIGWPLKPTDYPKGYGVADPPGFCLKTCDCMDDGRLQTQREMEKKWLDDGTRDLAVLMAIQNFSNQRHFVQRRGQVSNQHRFEHLLTLPSRSSRDSVHAVARSLADEVAREISNAMQEVPLEALFDREDQVRIPFLAFQKEGNDYRPLFFCITEAMSQSRWLTIHPTEGILTGVVEDPLLPQEMLAGKPNRCRKMRVEMLYPEAIRGTIDFMVKDIIQTSIESRSSRVVQRLHELSVPNCPLWQNLLLLLQEHLSRIYDFDLRRPKPRPFGRWLRSMEIVLRMLRSLPSANLVGDTPPVGGYQMKKPHCLRRVEELVD